MKEFNIEVLKHNILYHVSDIKEAVFFNHIYFEIEILFTIFFNIVNLLSLIFFSMNERNRKPTHQKIYLLYTNLEDF